MPAAKTTFTAFTYFFLGKQMSTRTWLRLLAGGLKTASTT